MNLREHPLDLRDRHYLITGAASGIGLATWRLVRRLGGRVAAVDADGDGLARATAELGGPPDQVRCFDLREVAGIPALMQDVATAGGPLSGVVHAAGLSCVQPARLLEPSKYRDVLVIHAEAALALARGFFHRKVSHPEGGSIVFLSSVMAWVGSPGAAAYGMSKAALTGLSKSLAVEFAPRKIRVNCVAPGFVRTPMFDRLSASWEEEQHARVAGEHPLGLGEAEDVANAVAFLLGDTGRWVTGSVLVVDGGYTAR